MDSERFFLPGSAGAAFHVVEIATAPVKLPVDESRGLLECLSATRHRANSKFGTSTDAAG